MTLNSTLRRMIADKAPRAAIEDELHKPGSGFISLRESALNLAREGITTSEEILRVVNDDN
jgi:type II secretory ATPase GspE/PulE/Tfp pilus assembly ATPase PilB-like protein